MPQQTLSEALWKDTAGTKIWQLVEQGALVPIAVRARHVSSQYGAMEVAVYGSGGNPTFSNAAALADGLANPTVGGVGAFGHGWGGATWDRLRTGAFAASTTPTGVMPHTNLAVYNSTPTMFTNGQYGHLHMGSRGALNVTLFNENSVTTPMIISTSGLGDGTGSSIALSTNSFGWAYNGATYDRLRSVGTGTLKVAFYDAAGNAWTMSNDSGDAISATTMPPVRASNMGWNGVTWDRLRAGAFTPATSATGVLNTLPLSIYNTTLPTYTNGQFGTPQMGSRGAMHVQVMSADGTAAALAGGYPGADALAAGNIALATGAFNLGFNGATWDRLRSGDVNNVAAATGYLATLGVARYNATLPTLTDTRYNALQVGSRGGLHVNVVGKDSTTGADVTGWNTFGDGANNAGMAVAAANWGFNGATWDRLRVIAATANMAATDKLLEVAASIYAYDATAGAPMRIRNAADMIASSNGRETLAVAPTLHNGATWDPQKNNTEGALLASAARTADTTSADQTNHNARGVIVHLNISAASGTGGLVMRFQMKDPVSGNYIDVNAAPTARTTAEYFTYIWYPGASMAVAANLHQVNAAPLPRTWRVRVAHADGSSYTYSVAYSLIV